MKRGNLIQIFEKLSIEEKYEKIISMGKALPPFPSSLKTEQNLVIGCQSTLYLSSESAHGLIYFNADSEALISKGLAAILIHLYSGEIPETILKAPSTFLEQLGLHQALSPARSNGVYSLLRKMQTIALNRALEKKI